MKILKQVTAVIIALFLLFDAASAKAKASTIHEYTDEVTVSLKAVGDNLIHSGLIGKDYDNFYSGVKEYMSDADLRMINQETMFIKDKAKYSGYPCFGTPTGVGKAMVNAGFNVITCATNHSLDKGFKGIEDTVSFWDKHEDVLMTGIYADEGSSEKISTIEVNGVTFAVLNYTYGTNGISFPKGKEYCVNKLSKAKIKADIKKAKEKADFVIVCPHWGVEYTHKPTKEQTDLAAKIAEWGADVIIGAHPHVVEPLEVIVTKKGREVPCFYSLGNFISAQNKQATMLGAMAKVTFTLDKASGDKKVTAKMTPLVTWFNKSYTEYKTYLLSDYTDELAKTHGLKNITKKELKKLWKEIVK